MVIIVYGYDGSGPGHWQRWLYDQLRDRSIAVQFPELPDPSEPQKDVWVDQLTRLVDESVDPVTFVCHSLACWAVDHMLAERGAANVHAALLVAPPSPYLVFEPVDSFIPPPRQRAAWAPLAARSLIVASDNDDFASADEVKEVGKVLGIRHKILSGTGHINVASGFGPWPLALEWVEGAIGS
jgi:predicted alpha/beta hydrolase family esterase